MSFPLPSSIADEVVTADPTTNRDHRRINNVVCVSAQSPFAGVRLSELKFRQVELDVFIPANKQQAEIAVDQNQFGNIFDQQNDEKTMQGHLCQYLKDLNFSVPTL